MGILDFFYDLTARLFDRDDLHEPPASPAAAAPATIPHIPAEIVLAILDAVHASGSPAQTQPTLAACALVCTSWSTAAQKLLFRRVSLDTQPALAGFLSAVAPGTPRSRTLAAAVRALHIVADAQQPRGLSHAAVAHAVRACPRLAALELAVYAAPAQHAKAPAPLFDAATLSALAAGPCIASLRFDNWGGAAGGLAQLLAVFPGLTALELGGSTLPALPPSPMPTPSLSTLHIHTRTPPAEDVLTWLLHDAHLASLAFALPPPPPTLAALLLAHGPSLTSLAVPAPPSLATCPRLRHLRLDRLPPALPASLQTLDVALEPGAGLAAVVEAVARGGLRRVRVRGRGRVEGLRMACAVRGVALEEC